MNYSFIAKQAASAIKSAGKSLTFTRETPGTKDPRTGTSNPSTFTTFTANALALEYSAKDAGLSYIEGTTVRTDDKKVLVEVGSYKPDMGDKVTIQGVDFEVIGIQTLAPGGIDLMYTLQVRR